MPAAGRDGLGGEAGRGSGVPGSQGEAAPFEDSIEQAEAITAVVPPDFRIWADANWTLGSVGQAVEMTKRLNTFQQYFAIESPCHRASIEHYRQLKGRVPMKVAEHLPSDRCPSSARACWTLLSWAARSAGRRCSALDGGSDRRPALIEHSIITGVAQVFQAHQTAAFSGIEYAISITHVIQTT